MKTIILLSIFLLAASCDGQNTTSTDSGDMPDATTDTMSDTAETFGMTGLCQGKSPGNLCQVLDGGVIPLNGTCMGDGFCCFGCVDVTGRCIKGNHQNSCGMGGSMCSSCGTQICKPVVPRPDQYVCQPA